MTYEAEAQAFMESLRRRAEDSEETYRARGYKGAGRTRLSDHAKELRNISRKYDIDITSQEYAERATLINNPASSRPYIIVRAIPTGIKAVSRQRLTKKPFRPSTHVIISPPESEEARRLRGESASYYTIEAINNQAEAPLYYLYLPERRAFTHLMCGEDLIERGAQFGPYLWNVIEQGTDYRRDQPAIHKLSESRALLEGLRQFLAMLCASNYQHRFWADAELHNQPVSVLLSNTAHRRGSTNYWNLPRAQQVLQDGGQPPTLAIMTFRYYFEAIDLMQIQEVEDFSRPIGDIVTQGRNILQRFIEEHQEIENKARWLRDKIAADYGYEYESRQLRFKRSKAGHLLTIDLTGAVHLDGKYLCIVPNQYGHEGNKFPMDDIIAGKMIVLATGERERIWTLNRVNHQLEAMFK